MGGVDGNIYNIMYDCGYLAGQIHHLYKSKCQHDIYDLYSICNIYILYNSTIYSMYAVVYSSLHVHPEYHNLQIKMYILW